MSTWKCKIATKFNRIESVKGFCCLCYAITLIFCCVATFLPICAKEKFIFFRTVSIAAIFETVVFLYCIFKVQGRVISWGTLFVLFMFVFNFGQVVLLAFFSKLYTRILVYNVIELVPFQNYVHALRLMNVSFGLMCFGHLKT